MAASPESFGPSSSSSSLPLLHLDGFRLLFLARPRLREPQPRRSNNPFPTDPSQLPRTGCCGRGVAAPQSITVLSGRLPRKIDGGYRVPGGFAPISAGLRGRVCVCGEEPGAEGGLGIEATSFYCRRGFFFNFFFFKIDWSPSLFLGGEHYFKPVGRLWVSPGHPVLITARPFWRGSK